MSAPEVRENRGAHVELSLLRRLDEIYRAIWHLDSKKEDRW